MQNVRLLASIDPSRQRVKHFVQASGTLSWSVSLRRSRREVCMQKCLYGPCSWMYNCHLATHWPPQDEENERIPEREPHRVPNCASHVAAPGDGHRRTLPAGRTHQGDPSGGET